MASFTSVADFKSVLQRKALVGAVFVADYSEDFLEDICTSGGELDIPTAYESVGKITSDGITYGGEVEKQEDIHWGDTSPSRIDVESEEITLGWSSAETRRLTLELAHSVDLDGVSPDESTGTISFDKAPLPVLSDRRIVALFSDVNKSTGQPVYMGIAFPRGITTLDGEQTFAKEEGGLVYPLSTTAQLDDAEGTAARFFLGGAGLSDMVTEMGFDAA